MNAEKTSGVDPKGSSARTTPRPNDVPVATPMSVPARRRSRTWVAGLAIALVATVPLIVLMLLPSWLLPSSKVERAPEEETAPAQAVAPPPPAPPASATVEPAEAPPSERVVGHVVDPDGNPVAGAFVSCTDRDREIAANANAEGRFELAAEADG